MATTIIPGMKEPMHAKLKTYTWNLNKTNAYYRTILYGSVNNEIENYHFNSNEHIIPVTNSEYVKKMNANRSVESEFTVNSYVLFFYVEISTGIRSGKMSLNQY